MCFDSESTINRLPSKSADLAESTAEYSAIVFAVACRRIGSFILGLKCKLKRILEQYRIRQVRGMLYHTEDEARVLESMVSFPQPSERQLAVCFFAPEQDGFERGGKVTAPEFLPLFCDHLRQRRIRTHFATSHRALKKALVDAKRSVVVCIYNELSNTPSDLGLMSILDNADMVFNHPRSGSIIGNKIRTNKALSDFGCLTPRFAETLDADALVFSNVIEGSGAYAFTSANVKELDGERYNTEFIDTIRLHEGIEYFTTIRLMCINDRITHQFIRARPVSEGNPSVHAKDTPKNADLINALHRDVSNVAQGQFQRIAKQVYGAFGPGFYCHDVLVDTQTNRAIVCETGYKFNDMAYQQQLHEIGHEVEGLTGYENAANAAVSSSPLFADELSQAFELPEPVPYGMQKK